MADALNFKLILLGDSAVGKTSLLKRFATGEFGQSEPTLDLFQQIIYVQCGKLKVALIINDTAGQERFRSITPNYYRETDGIVLVYDVTRGESFIALSSWLKEVAKECGNPPVVIVGNKTDAVDDRKVTLSTVQSFANEEGHEFLECSAKSNSNVNEVFFTTLKAVLEKKSLGTYDISEMSIIPVDPASREGRNAASKRLTQGRVDKAAADNLQSQLFGNKDDTIRLEEETAPPQKKESSCWC